MTSRNLMIVGVLCAVVTVVLLNIYVHKIESSQETVQVLRLKADKSLKKGDVVVPEIFEAERLPSSLESMLKVAVPFDSAEWVAGKRVNRDIDARDFILFSYFDEPGRDLEQTLDPNKRALTLQVNETTSVGYFVKPGSFVDVIGTLKRPTILVPPGAPSGVAERGRLSTAIILQNAKVLAVGDRTDRYSVRAEQPKALTYSSVTLEVTPEQAAKFLFAKENIEGEITLLLRNVATTSEPRTSEVSWDNYEQIR